MTPLPDQLIAAVPYALGFHPADSLVVASVDDISVSFAARLDLPPPDAPGEDLAQLAAVVARQGVTEVAVLGYGPPEHVTPAVPLLAAELVHRGVQVVDQVRVTDGRWWSYACADPECCPPEGHACPPPDSVIAAAATYAGGVALPDRAALVAQTAPVTGAERAALTRATARARSRRSGLRRVQRAGRAAVRAAEARHRSGGRLTDADVAWLSVLLTEEEIFEYAWARIGDERWRLAQWTDVLRRADPALTTAPACLLSFAAWRCGHGSLARIAVDRALENEPGHGVARLLHEILQHGVPPTVLMPAHR